jgi:hypothetical protein
MHQVRRAIQERSSFLVFLVCALLVLLPPAVAYASTIFPYANGTNGIGGTFQTPGANYRDFNRVYHQVGYFWDPYYCNFPHCWGHNLDWHNPVYANGGGYAIALCYNYDDNTGTPWVCQTTKP